MTMDNIYQLIWDNDENQFSVSGRQPSGEWHDETADILLDEQVRASGKRQIDLATQPLFYRVNEEKLFDVNRTYNSFINLLDNYAVHFLDEELTDEKEIAEQQEFLHLILKTKPIQIALEYINQNLGESFSEEKFFQQLKRIWFELYTNHYKGKSTHFCSGFEHVFVGEAKYNARFDSKKENLGEISGYHSWVKFYLDEKNQRVNFLGYKYDLNGQAGQKNPNVVTLQMLQTITDMRGNIVAEVFKKKGGFFVGPSPECEIAMATVAYYESVYGKIRDKRRTTIDNANYDIVVYRSTNPNGSRGEFIRSFFPIFIGSDSVEEPPMDRPVVVPIDRILSNNGAIQIIAALPNPEGTDEGREWVELQNSTDEAIDITGWELRDKLNRPEVLNGIIQPQETQRFMINRSGANTMQMTNRSGLILLYNSNAEQVAAVQYNRARSGTILQFQE
jgi:poly(U)-specific endoribonuclease